jgi:hypothetical protein
MVQKAPKVPECPNALANLLQNYFPILRNANQEVANLVMKTEFRDVFDGGRYRWWQLRRDFSMFCENLIFGGRP